METILAAILLTAPPDEPIPTALADALRPSIIAIAINAELIDPREVFIGIDELRQRNGNLPHVAETDRFPCYRTLCDWLAMNRMFRRSFVAQLDIDVFHEELLRDAIAECDRAYCIIDHARDAAHEIHYVYARRQSLGVLRGLIGDEAFYSGRLPHFVPLHHMARD